MLAALAAAAIAALLRWTGAPPVLIFVTSAIALGAIAYLIGEATSQLGNHLHATAAGIVQSVLGNLPELLICIFALQAGAVAVVQAALVGLYVVMAAIFWWR